VIYAFLDNSGHVNDSLLTSKCFYFRGIIRQLVNNINHDVDVIVLITFSAYNDELKAGDFFRKLYRKNICIAKVCNYKDRVMIRRSWRY
jgi:hypothetical protein